jgi:hypothetical protein
MSRGSLITGWPRRDMREPHIAVAVRQRTAMPREPKDSSPYLDHVRPTRKIIDGLISAREIELAKANTRLHSASAFNGS